MKRSDPSLASYITSAIDDPTLPIVAVDCYSITLITGTVLSYSAIDIPVTYGGVTYLANGPSISGLKYNGSMGASVDTQQVVIQSRLSDAIGGTPFLTLVRAGLLDGARITRMRFVMPSLTSDPVGGAVMFSGRVSTVDSVGETSATISVASDLVILSANMPTNIFSPTCTHVLYDSGCKAIKGAFATNGTVSAGSTSTVILFSGALISHMQGTTLFTSGANTNLFGTIKSVTPGVSLTLTVPLPSQPQAGDTFISYYGCDHTLATCKSVFSNVQNFRGFPFLPPPQTAQ